MSKRFTRQEMMDRLMLQINRHPMTGHQYRVYRFLGYGDGRTLEQVLEEIAPHLASDEAFQKMYPDNPVN